MCVRRSMHARMYELLPYLTLPGCDDSSTSAFAPRCRETAQRIRHKSSASCTHVGTVRYPGLGSLSQGDDRQTTNRPTDFTRSPKLRDRPPPTHIRLCRSQHRQQQKWAGRAAGPEPAADRNDPRASTSPHFTSPLQPSRATRGTAKYQLQHFSSVTRSRRLRKSIVIVESLLIYQKKPS